MMIVAALAVAFNVILGLLLHGVCQIPHSHSHHSHLPKTETHTEEESDNDEPESQVRILKKVSNGMPSPSVSLNDTGTNIFEVALNPIKFLVRPKKFGMAQNILRHLEGKGSNVDGFRIFEDI